MKRVSRTEAGWAACHVKPVARVTRPGPPALEATELEQHRAERGRFVRWQTRRADQDCRSHAVIAALVLVADGVLVGACTLAAGFLPDETWLGWFMLLLLLGGGAFTLASALAAVTGLWCAIRASGGSGPALANPNQTAQFPDPGALRAALHHAARAEMERQAEAEWLRVARNSRCLSRAVLWAAALFAMALALACLAVVVLLVSGL